LVLLFGEVEIKVLVEISIGVVIVMGRGLASKV